MKWDVLKQGLTSGQTYNASVQDYYENMQKQYEKARRQQAAREKQRREYERQLKKANEQKAKQERERKEYLEKLKNDTSAAEREQAAVRAQEAWGRGETPNQKDIDLFEVSDYKKALANGEDGSWYDKAWRKIKDFFLSADGITATGWKTNDIQASQFSGNLAMSNEDQTLLSMAEDYFRGNKTPENLKAVREMNKRKPGFLNSLAVHVNKVLDWAGNNSLTGTTGAFLGTNELDKVRIGIDFDENTSSEQALQNIASLRDSYKALDEESYNAYLENYNKARYYENMLSDEYKRKVDVAEGRIADENGVVDPSVDFFNFSKLAYQLPGIIAGSISSPSQLISSLATGIFTAGRVTATATAAGAATVGTGGWGAVAIPSILAAGGAAATFGLNQSQGAHENAAEVDEGYISKVRHDLEQHPEAAADFYRRARSVLGESATEEQIITAKLANKIPAQNKIIDKVFDEAALGNQRQYDRDMVATTMDSTIDTALQITPLKFFSTLGKRAIKANLRSSRIARAANKITEGLSKLDGGTDGVLRKAFGKYGAMVSAPTSAIGAGVGTVFDNTIGRIPKVNTAIKAMAHFDIPKIKRIGPKASNWINYGESILGRGFKSALSEGIEEGKQYYNQQRALQEFQEGLRNGNLSFETQTILGDLLDDFQAGNFAASGLVQAITGIPMLDYLHYTDSNIIDAAEAIINIKSGMIGGHGQTAITTAFNGAFQTYGTHKDIDYMEQAIRALEESKLTAQKQFAQDQILSRTNPKYISNAIEYLKNSSSIKLTDQELEDLQHRAIEVRGVSQSPYVKALAKELGIADEDYHKFVADYMYHKDNVDTERDNLQDATQAVRTKVNDILAKSQSIENPSQEILEQWRKNDNENNRRIFESKKADRIEKVKHTIKQLNEKLKDSALTESEKADIQKKIEDNEKYLKEAEASEFKEESPIEYAQARLDRIDILARIRGTIKQLNFLNAILSSMGEENESGRKFVQSEVDATKKLLDGYLKGNMLEGNPLTSDNLAEVNRWANIIARNIERADKDNMAIAAASDELAEDIDSLAQAYQEHSNAVLNYNIVSDLFSKFVGYDTKDGNIVPEGTEGAKHVKGNAKEHLEGIMAAQDDDAKLEQAYQQGFADYGFAGVYKNESPLVQAEEEEEERAKPGTRERRNRIKELGKSIRDFATRSKNYISGVWKSFGYKKVFVPDDIEERGTPDPSENQMDAQEYYDKIVADYKAADDVEKWLNAPAIDTDETGNVKTNAHLLISAYLNTKKISDGISVLYGNMDNPSGYVYYKGVPIGLITPLATLNKANGNSQNQVDIFGTIFPFANPSATEAIRNSGNTILDLDRLDDDSYLSGIVDLLIIHDQSDITRVVQENGKIRLQLPSHTENKPREIVIDPQGDNKYYVHIRMWDDVDKKIPASGVTDEQKQQLFDALYNELSDGAEILLPKSGPGYYATRGTIAGLQRLARDPRFTPGTKGTVEYLDKDGKTVKTFHGTSFIKGRPSFTSSADITDKQLDIVYTLVDLRKKMSEKFDTSLRTSSHYFEWVGTGENRKLKLWHRLHDEIGSHFIKKPEERKDWSDVIKQLYSVVYHKGYEDETSRGVKDIQALLDRLQNYYQNEDSTERLLDRIDGYIQYLTQEGDDITDADLYECIKGIAEETIGERNSKQKSLSLDRGTATDELCRVILGYAFPTPQEAIAYCDSLTIRSKNGETVLIKDYFTKEGFEGLVTHLWNTRKVYVEDLGYTLWTAPFTIYTEDFTNKEGNQINIAGEVDMLAIDKDGHCIIIDYKTSKYEFLNKNGKLTIYFKEQGDKYSRSPLEQYTNQQSAYIQMLNETTRKETSMVDGFVCNEARLLPIVLIQDEKNRDLVKRADIQFSKDQQLVLKTIPFRELGDKEGLIMDKESYRAKLSKLSKLYAKVDYITNHLRVYYGHIKDRSGIEQINGIREDLDSIFLSLQEITFDDLNQYEERISDAIANIMSSYFNNKELIDEIFVKYNTGELHIADEETRARSYNNLDWKNRIYDEDIEQLGGFSAMGVKDRKEYDEKVDELAHVACNRDFQSNSSAKLTAVQYKTRRGNDKIAVYASITYKGTTYPPVRLYLSKTTGQQFAKDVLDGNVFGGNIQTTIGLLSECSDGNQHFIGENKQLIDAIGGTEEDPYGNFRIVVDSNPNVAVVTFNKSTGSLTTISRTSTGEVIALPKNLKKSSPNGHIIINVIPDNSNTGVPIPIICNTPQIKENLGKDPKNHRSGSLLDFIVEDVLQQLNNVEGGNALNQRYVTKDGEEVPLTFKQILDFFFEPFDTANGSLVERPQYEIVSGIGQSRFIRIGDFSTGARTISLDNIEGLKNAIRELSIWVSADMASVKWNSSEQNSEQFNEFAKWLAEYTKDGKKFYLGNSGIYFDKSDVDGTYLGFLAKNGLLTTPFVGFSHPLISINSCHKEAPISPALGEGGDDFVGNGPVERAPRRKKKEEPRNYTDEDIGWEEEMDIQLAEFNEDDEEDYNEAVPRINLHKLQQGKYKLDQTAARQYIERVLGKSFADSKLKFVDEISSAIVGGLSAGTIIAGQVTANLMKLSRYAQNGTEYHETFHWAFELIIDPRDSERIRSIVRKKYGITDEREIAEWLADTYMTYINTIYTPKGNILQQAFDKIKQWGITFAHMFTGEYQIYKLYNAINSGKFVNKPLNNEAVLRFQEKFRELNSKMDVPGYEYDGMTYKYVQGPVDLENNIKQLAFFALTSASSSPALNYAKNTSITINIRSVFDKIYCKDAMMTNFTTKQLEAARRMNKYRKMWRKFDIALALRELLDEEHIDKTNEYVNGYIDRLIGVKGQDVSTEVEDTDDKTATFDESYMAIEDGEPSEAGGNKEHLIPDHKVSRMSKTSSRIKLFFGTIPVVRWNEDKKRYDYTRNRFGMYGYYDLKEIYGSLQNRYHGVLSPQALWDAIEADSKDSDKIASLHLRINGLRRLASKGNDNAIGLLNEIYKSIKSAKFTEEVAVTTYDRQTGKLNHRFVDIMIQNNSFAICREFSSTVFGNFNKFYQQVSFIDEEGNETWGIEVRPTIYDDEAGEQKDANYRLYAYEDFFGFDTPKVNVAEKNKNGEEVITNKVAHSIYNVIVSYGTNYQYPFYVKDAKRSKSYKKDVYVEASIEDNIPYIKYKLIEALATVGIDITTDQLDDILETSFRGTGISEIRQLLIEPCYLQEKGSPTKTGNSITLYNAVTNLNSLIDAELIAGRIPTDKPNGTHKGGHVIRQRKDVKNGQPFNHNGLNVFRNQPAHILIATLLAFSQREKYERSGIGVDGKSSYAMSDDNTVTAMCDVIFDKTNDVQCSKIRQMILNDPFNTSAGVSQFGNIPIGSFILPRVQNDLVRGEKLRTQLSALEKQLDDDSLTDDQFNALQKQADSIRRQLKLYEKRASYEIINDGGIETGNKENSSTDSEKRGADTIISIIMKLCKNQIVVAPFADKSTALSVRLKGIKIPGIDYSKVTYQFKTSETEEKDRNSIRESNTKRQFTDYIASIDVDDTGRVVLNTNNNELDETVAGYVLAEYYQAKKAIQDYEDLLRNHASPDNNTQVEEKYKTAFNICKKLMFMSQFSGDYVQVKDDATGQWKWVFKPFSVENGADKSDVEAAKEMLRQFEDLVKDRATLLDFVNRHINGLMQHELEKLQEFGIVRRLKPTDTFPNPDITNQLLDQNIIRNIFAGVSRRNQGKSISIRRKSDQAVRIFMYDIVGKSIISKQESERLFTGQSDLYNIVRDKETRIITVPYQDQAKRIGSFASTGTVGAIENEDYVCAEIQDDEESIEDQVARSVYMNEIAGYIKTGNINMAEHPDFDFRYATLEEIKNLIPKEFQPIVDNKVKIIMKGFVTRKKNGSEIKNNVTDGAAFISAKFAERLVRQQGAWNNEIARAFKILTSNDKHDIEQILTSYETFSKVWTQVIGTYKYTAVGFRTENVNGQDKVVQFVNKYSLAPIFACMCNDKMEAIRTQMDKQGVDMLMFESAVKVGAHGNSKFSVDNNGKITGEFNTYSQKTFFLRKQLNTDPNEKEIMKIGIQTVKVALSAVIGEEGVMFRGQMMNGDQIIQAIMDDIDRLTDARTKKLMAKLSTEKQVADYVAKFLRGNNIPENIVKAFLDDFPAEALSIQKHVDTLSAKRIQQDIVRINTPGSAFIQRTVYGMEGPAKFGSLELNDGEELKVVNSDGSMDCVLSLDYFVEYRKGIPYFKLTPKGQKRIALMVYDKELGKKRPMSFEEIRQWLKDNNVIGKNAKSSILSYRIPTQAVASINALKCVDVIPVVRDTVILPKLFTTITGSDFDIDKLFISTVWYKMEEQEDGTYKPSQLELDRSEDELENATEEELSNAVVNDYIDVLCLTAKNHPEVFYRSIDQDTKLADDVIAWMDNLFPITDDDKLVNASGMLHSMPSMQAKVHDEFQAGKKGIGPFALALVNHVLTRIYNVKFKDEGIYLSRKRLDTDKDENGNSIMSWLSAMINKHVDAAKNPDITKLNVNNSTFNVVALLLRLGYGRRTFMFTCQHIMKDYAFAIDQQTAVCKYTKNDNGYTDARRDAYNEMIAKYNLSDTKEKLKGISERDIQIAACREIFDKDIDGKSLLQLILENGGKVPSTKRTVEFNGKTRQTEEWQMKIKIGKKEFELTDKLFQYLNLELFNYLSDAMATPLSQLQQASVIDNERCITSMIQSEFYKQQVEKVKTSDIFTNIDKLFSKSYIDKKIKASLDAASTIYDGVSCMDKSVVTAVAKAIDPNILSYGRKRMQIFLSNVRDGITAYHAAKFFDQYCKDNNIDRRKLFNASDENKKSIIRRLAGIQASTRGTRGQYRSLRNNLLIKGLSVEGIVGEEYIENEDSDLYNKHRFMGYQFLKFKYSGQSDKDILADVQQAWQELLDYPDETIKTFARDLIVYAFYTSGEMSGKTKLFKYVPPGWRVSSGYGDHFKNLKNDKGDQYLDLNDIVDKLCRNLWYKDQFVRKIGLGTLGRFYAPDVFAKHTKTVMSEDGSEEVRDPIGSPVICGIEYILQGEELVARQIFKGDRNQCPRYIKCVNSHHDSLTTRNDDATSWILYKLVGFETYTNSNGKSWEYPVYVQTSILGEKYFKNNVFEYNEELEPNPNMDAYAVVEEFISKLGNFNTTHNLRDKITDSDISSVVEKLTTLLEEVDKQVAYDLTNSTTDISELAGEVVDLVMNRKTRESTFVPYRIVNEFMEQKRKSLEAHIQDVCK